MIEICIEEVGRVITRNVETPKAENGEALISVKSAGICGSDIHVFEGRNPGLTPPHVAGHEFGGRVEVLDGDVPGISVGDIVAVNPVLSCRSCGVCASGYRYLCGDVKVIGGRHPGAMREQIAVPVENLVKIPSDFPIEWIALVEPLANVLHFADVIRNKTVLIIGSGTIGLLTLMLCKLNGNFCACSDIDEGRLEHATRLGADITFNFSDDDKDGVTEKIGDGAGFDVVLDIVCSAETLAYSTSSGRRHGDIVMVGIPPGPVPISVGSVMVKELRVTSTYMFLDSEFTKAAAYLARGLIDGSSLITTTFPFADAHQAFSYKAHTPSAKVVLVN